jgi:hypothetical protein
MLWFLKYFRRKIQRKNWRFRLKTKLNNAKIWSWHWFLRKTPIFRRKLAKIVENCDHNIDPRCRFSQNFCRNTKMCIQILGTDSWLVESSLHAEKFELLGCGQIPPGYRVACSFKIRNKTFQTVCGQRSPSFWWTQGGRVASNYSCSTFVSCQPNLVAATYSCTLLHVKNICLTYYLHFLVELTLVDTGRGGFCEG